MAHIDSPEEPIGRRPKRVLRPAVTRSVERLGPQLVAVTVAGPGLDGFELIAPAQHIQLYLPEGGVAPALADGDGGLVFADPGAHPTVRTYTPRRFNPATGELEILLVVHGAGPGSGWAERAAIGDPVVIGGPAGGYEVDAGASRYVLAGDESALPALATVLEALPATTRAEVHVEVPDGQPELTLSSPAPTSIQWRHRRPDERAGDSLVAALTDPDAVARHLNEAPDVRFWMAGEAAASRQIRRTLIDRHGLDRDVAYTRAYWKYGKGG